MIGSEVLIDGLLVLSCGTSTSKVLTQAVTTKEAVVSAVQIALYFMHGNNPVGLRDAACPWEGRWRPEAVSHVAPEGIGSGK